MTKEMLLKLCSQQYGKISVDDILNLYKDLSDDEIEIILGSNNKVEIRTLITNENFKRLSQQIQKKLITIIDDGAHKGLTDFTVNNMAVGVATNENAINSGCVVDLTRIVRNSRGYIQAQAAAYISCSSYAIATDSVIELALIASQFSSEINEKEHLLVISQAATNSYITRSGRVVEIVKSIADAKDLSEALKIYNREVQKGKKIRIIDALQQGKITEIGFWDLFAEDYGSAMTILDKSSSINAEMFSYEMIDRKTPQSLPEELAITEYKLKEFEIKSYTRIRMKKYERGLENE